uniref:T9SS type A sorting domain-containing protein n=1 Tax=candidate division WOR-3 bacterium TaxID=2052148 RepID=A0A7C4XTC2_UNCW3
MKRFFYLLLLFSTAFGIVFEIPVEDVSYKIEKFSGYDRIYIKDGAYIGNPGAPEIRVVTFTYALPERQKISDIQIIDEEWQEIPGDFYLYPEQKRYPIDKTQRFTEINAEIYNSEKPYPLCPIIAHKSGNLRGYRICQFSVAPFRYLPRDRKLFLLKRLTIKVKTITTEEGIRPKRQSSLSMELFHRLVSSLTLNRLTPPACAITENLEDFTPLELPSLLGPPVDLIIITNEPLVLGYEKFCRLKKLFGFNTVVKTLTWIRQHYSGVDDAERIRNFVKDAVEKWGTSFVLLGGDVPEIPTRWVWLGLIDPDQWPENIVTDYYYSDLDGNWNFDGDERFGEVEDSLDLYPDIFVGRLSMATNSEVMNYFNKDYSYLFPVYPQIHIRWLGVTSDLFYPGDAYQLARVLADHLPPWFDTCYLNERPLQEFKDSIYSGFGIVQGIGHGDVNLFMVNNSPQYATNFFFDSLLNIDKYTLLIIISCYTGPFQSDCLGERWVNNPSGGGIAYIGPSGPSEGYIHTEILTTLYDSLFSFPIAEAMARSKIPYIPFSMSDNWYRFYIFSINLLSDPVITVWDSIPRTFDSIVVTPETLNIGIDTVTITLNPPVDSFEVIYYKENELFLRDSNFSGSIVSQIKTESPGYLKIVVHRRRFYSYIDSIYVAPSIPHLVYDHFTIRDSLNNNNGMLNPGEDIFLYVALKNNGGLTASGINAQIFSSDTFITILNSSSPYPDIYPNSNAENLIPFYFRVKSSIPDGHSIEFLISITYNGANSDSFQVIASAPGLKLFTQHCDSVNNYYLIFPDLENSGNFLADSVRCIISALSDTVTIVDSIAEFPIIYPNTVQGIVDTLSLTLNYPGPIRYNLRVYYRSREVLNKNIKIQSPPAPDSFRCLGMPNSILLNWKPVDGAIGYRIYRATNPSGPYEFMKNPLERVSSFEDFNAQMDIDYYYYLYAVDSSMNEGLPGDTLRARRNPNLAQGWPQTVYGYIYTSPNFGDLDPYPGLEITVATRDDGTVYAWHYDGTPIIHSPYNDGRIFSGGGECWTSPAIGDINNDGRNDIVFGLRRTFNNLYAISYYDSIYLPMPNWPITVPGRVFSAPVLGDLDNDGDLEIIVRTEGADIYVFNYDGTPYFPPAGLLFNGPGGAWGGPAVGDINNDGNLEIVSCGGSWSDSLYVWDRYGNYLSPFPIFIQSEYRLRCATVIGDIIGDSRPEIAFFADSTHKVYLVSPDGYILWFYELPHLELIESYPIFADITGDGRPELVCAESKTGLLVVFDSLGNPLPNFPFVSTEHDWRKVICADFDNDNISDIAVHANNWRLYGMDANIQNVPGFPIKFGNYLAPSSSPAVYDIDLDGKLELMVAPCDFKFYVFNLNTTKYEWPKFRYDPYNSGWYRSGNLPGVREIASLESEIKGERLMVYPNPFRNHLMIKFQIPNTKFQTNSKSENPKQRVAGIKIYDSSGRLVKSLKLSTRYSLLTTVIWDGTDNLGRRLPSGVYFVRLETDSFRQIEKVILLR